MRVLVVGNGGREDALSRKLAESNLVTEVIVSPGRERLQPLAKITTAPVSANDIAGLIRLAEERAVDLIIPGPEAPIVAGLADAARRARFDVFGPTARAARITEGSKCEAKKFMKRNNIPTAEPFRCFNPSESPSSFIYSLSLPIVVKDDELASGKGVTIAKTREAALAAADNLSGRGHKYVIEPHLSGWEMTYTCLVAGTSFVPLATSQDNKLLDGKMTGGMVTVSPEPYMTPELEEKITDRIVRPTIRGLNTEGYYYRGFLYFGLMIVDGEPHLLEYNCRLGDPEAQVILPRLWEDLAHILQWGARGILPTNQLRWDPRAAACIVLASQGYPENPVMGAEITGVEEVEAEQDAFVFHAGTAVRDGKLVVAGGRVLGVTALNTTPRTALERALMLAMKIRFKGRQYLNCVRDVGQ